MQSKSKDSGVARKCALRGAFLVAASGLLCMVNIQPSVAQDEYPAGAVELVSATLSEALSQLEGVLQQRGVTEIGEISVVSRADKPEDVIVVTFKVGPLAGKPIDIDEDLLLLPKASQGNPKDPDWIKVSGKFTISYVSSPGTILTCDPKAGGRRKCTED